MSDSPDDQTQETQTLTPFVLGEEPHQWLVRQFARYDVQYHAGRAQSFWNIAVKTYDQAQAMQYLYTKMFNWLCDGKAAYDYEAYHKWLVDDLFDFNWRKAHSVPAWLFAAVNPKEEPTPTPHLRVVPNDDDFVAKLEFIKMSRHKDDIEQALFGFGDIVERHPMMVQELCSSLDGLGWNTERACNFFDVPFLKQRGV